MISFGSDCRASARVDMTMQPGIGAVPTRRGYELPVPAHERPRAGAASGRGHPSGWGALTLQRGAVNMVRRPWNVQSGIWTSTPTTWTSGWIADALTELAEIDDEIAEECFSELGPAVKREAERILKSLAWHPLAPAIYPTPDAEVAIHFHCPHSSGSVLILLNSDGQADCYAYIRGHRRRARYDTASDLPDDFVREQLRASTGRRDVASPMGWTKPSCDT